jgi:hypothetical protein
MNNKRARFLTALLISGFLSSNVPCQTASLPSSVLPAVTQAIQRDFMSIDRVETYSMSDEINGRFDVVVIGTERAPSGKWGGWRVEVLSVHNHRLTKRWDSAISAREVEFAASGPGAVEVREMEYDYDLVVGGCAQHLCKDGISGFLLFSGKTGKTYKAKLVTQGLDESPTGSPKYDQAFSPDISEDAKKVLQEAICKSGTISNKQGLPFACKNP